MTSRPSMDNSSGNDKRAPSTASMEKAEALTPHLEDSPFAKRTLLWMDIRILPILALVYSFSFIDRINLGAAYAAGMANTLELTVGARYTIVTCLYFVPYILLQLPGNFVLRKFGVRNWLGFLVLAWGSVQLGMGFVKNWHELLATRVLLGAFEAPLYPALVWLISAWYKRYEVQTRISIFSMLAGTAGGMSPLLGYGLSLLEGKRGLEGWRWIFIVEGVITIFLALVTFLFIPAFPEENSFLSKEQTEFVIRRIDEDRGDALPDEITLSKVLHHLTDWTLWAYGVLFMLAVMPNYATGYFLPIILSGMGYDRKGTLIRSAMPSIAAIPVIVAVGWLSDRYQKRAIFIACLVLVSILGCSLTAWHSNNGVRYFGAFLTYIASVAGGPTIVAYSSNNVVGHSKRAVQTATMVACGSVGGILAATLFRNQDRPKYIPGLIATMVSQAIIAVVLVALTLRHRYWNKRARDGSLTEPLEGQVGFLYTL